MAKYSYAGSCPWCKKEQEHMTTWGPTQPKRVDRFRHCDDKTVAGAECAVGKAIVQSRIEAFKTGAQ